MKVRIVILQHSKGTPPGSILDWHADRRERLNADLKIDLRKLHEGAALPSLLDFDLLLVLGGPMNVDEIERYPWLAAEKKLLRETAAAGKPCLGICLGGQLLAQALGGSVRSHTHWEVGWHPVRLEAGEELTVFQWHQDTFELPPGAEPLATNAITPNQGFTFGRGIVALQFHPEATAEWVKECADDGENYPTGPFVQNPHELTEGLSHIPKMRAWLFELLDQMTKAAASKRGPANE